MRICGPIPGVVLGALSSAINSLSEPTAIAYIPVTVACGLVAGLLGESRIHETLWKSLIAGFLLAVAAVGNLFSHHCFPVWWHFRHWQ